MTSPEGRTAEGRGLPLHRLPLRPGRERPGDRQRARLRLSSRPSAAATDNFSVEIAFADGGVGTLHYAADAPRGPGKERFETSSPGRLRRARGLSAGTDLARAARSAPRRRAPGQGLRGAVQVPRRACAGKGGAPAARELLALGPGDARGRALARDRPAGESSSWSADLGRRTGARQAVEAMAEHDR